MQILVILLVFYDAFRTPGHRSAEEDVKMDFLAQKWTI